MGKMVRRLAALSLALAATASAAFAGGWEDDTCNETEIYNGVECELIWCVNDDDAFYVCDGLSTHKYTCSEGCEDPVE